MLTAIRDIDNKNVLAKNEEKGTSTYHCPECLEKVELAKGMFKVSYFKHKSNSECCYSGETELHLQIKQDIFDYISSLNKSSIIDLQVEKSFGKSFRPDVYFQTKKGNKIAIEIQASDLTIQEILTRTEKYFKNKIYVLWIVPFEYDRFFSINPLTNEEEICEAVKLKEYELFMHSMYFKQLFFWDIKHKYSSKFILLRLDDFITDGAEFYTEGGEYQYFEPKKLKQKKSITEIIENVDLVDFKVNYAKRFDIPSKNYYIPERYIFTIDNRKKIMKMKNENKNNNSFFTYHVEDGQFSRDIELSKLLGKEGEKIMIQDDFGEDFECYILFIQGNYVQCIGNIERSYPKNWKEHNELKKTIIELND